MQDIGDRMTMNRPETVFLEVALADKTHKRPPIATGSFPVVLADTQTVTIHRLESQSKGFLRTVSRKYRPQMQMIATIQIIILTTITIFWIYPVVDVLTLSLNIAPFLLKWVHTVNLLVSTNRKRLFATLNIFVLRIVVRFWHNHNMSICESPEVPISCKMIPVTLSNGTDMTQARQHMITNNSRSTQSQTHVS